MRARCLVNMSCEYFDISDNGFLPDYCCQELHPSFSYLQPAIDVLEETKCQNIRPIVDQLPKISTSLNGLSIHEIRYVYSVCSMICNRYIWCSGVHDAKNYADLPLSIGEPFLQASEYLGIAPVVTNASLDLYNWHPKDHKLPIGLDNIEINHTMTGDISEQWFHKIAIAIEAVGGKLLPDMLTIHTADKLQKEVFLQKLYGTLVECTSLIKRMNEHCDPHFFFNNIRIYFSGSINDNLPNNVRIGDRILKFKGASAAQSSLIPLYDILLGIEHSGDNGNFLTDMLDYMPRKHRDCIRQMGHKGPLCVDSDTHLIELFNKCIDQLGKFRMAHLGLIHGYVAKFKGDSSNEGKTNAHGELGSGSTKSMKFCSDIIRDTMKSKLPIINGYYISNEVYVIAGVMICWIVMCWMS